MVRDIESAWQPCVVVCTAPHSSRHVGGKSQNKVRLSVWAANNTDILITRQNCELSSALRQSSYSNESFDISGLSVQPLGSL